MMQLHYHPGNASFAPHVLLHEIGAPFELKLVQRMQGEHRQPEYLKLNPNGQIPVLVDGELVLYEAAAICMHLADTHPGAALAPPLGTRERAHFYKWMAWLSNTLQAMLMHYFYPERLVDEGDSAAAQQVKTHAQARVVAMLALLDAQLASHGGPWLLGAHYSAVDPYAFMLCRWTRGFTGPAAAPARERPAIRAWLGRLLARPAVQRVLADEQLPPPWV